jgi:addiction module HigA family antidote
MAAPQEDQSFHPTYAITPGHTIADLLDEQGMTQTELAQRLGVTLKHVNQVVNGGASLSPELALGLEKVFGASADFWLNRESLYRADSSRKAEAQSLQEHVSWAAQFPVKELTKRGYVPTQAKGAALVDALLRFLGVASPPLWQDPVVAYRKSQRYESDPFALAAWLRVGELEARAIDTEPYSHDAFLDALQEARQLTRLEPEERHPQLVEILGGAGVAVVVVDTFKNARANGATRWLTPTKALIQLSLRYHWEDIFWFTFFHEAGHIALHRKKGMFVEGLKPAGKSAPDDWWKLEDEANRFAARTLIPESYHRHLPTLAATDIEPAAHELGIAPAMIVGRLQHDGVIPYNLWNEYRRRLEFRD